MNPPPFTPLSGGSFQLAPLYAALDNEGVFRGNRVAGRAFGTCRVCSGRPFANAAVALDRTDLPPFTPLSGGSKQLAALDVTGVFATRTARFAPYGARRPGLGRPGARTA